MNSEQGGQSTSDLQRRAASEIARKKVLAAYSGSNRRLAGQSDPSDGHMKTEPGITRIDSESWKRYHSAWQNYYQKYYSEYYSKAAQTYIEKEKLKRDRERAEEEDLLRSISKSSLKSDRSSGLSLRKKRKHQGASESSDIEEGIRDELRYRIRKKATDNARKTRRFRRLMPILAGLAVVLLILFLQYNRLVFAPIMAYISPGNAPVSELEAVDPSVTQAVSPEPRLIIPKLNVDVPIRFGIPLGGVMDAMNNGVAHYRIAGASSYPGQVGNTVITGHSAGDIYSSNPYKYIFSGLERLDDGDLIYINYESVRYTYKVIKKQVIEPTDVGALVIQTDKPLLTLVTCTPLGTSRYRLLVTAEQVSPRYENGANTSDGINIDQNTDQASNDTSTYLPSNEPSFFEGIWNWLTGN